MMVEKIEKRVRIIQRAYLGIACLAALDLFFQFADRLERKSTENIGNTIVYLFICIAAYIGLKQRRNWIIPLLLITSLWILIQTLLAIVEPALTKTAFAAKIIQFMVLFFYWYQAFFFSRQEIRQYFGSRGTILF